MELEGTFSSGKYIPSASEMRRLADWGCLRGEAIVFPPHHPNDAKWEAENGSYLKVHQFEDAVKAQSKVEASR